MVISHILPLHNDLNNCELQTLVLLHIFNAELQYTSLVLLYRSSIKALCMHTFFCYTGSLHLYFKIHQCIWYANSIVRLVTSRWQWNISKAKPDGVSILDAGIEVQLYSVSRAGLAK